MLTAVGKSRFWGVTPTFDLLVEVFSPYDINYASPVLKKLALTDGKALSSTIKKGPDKLSSIPGISIDGLGDELKAACVLSVAPGDDSNSTVKVYNILMVGAGDIRHVLLAMSRLNRHAVIRIRVFVLEQLLENYCRNLLFVNIALESPAVLGIQEKVEYMLEMMGNTLTRDQTMKYLCEATHKLIKYVTDPDLLASKLPVDINLLKHKERDFMEGIIKSWRNYENVRFNMSDCWDGRLRHYLGSRYDAIPNVFDWDYSMTLCDRGGEIIRSREYVDWRRTGVAFKFRDGNYTANNLTLTNAMIILNANRDCVKGYWGDMLSSPYIAFGIETEEKSFYQQSNRIYAKSAHDISEYNLTSMLYEILHRTPYKLPKEETKTNEATITELPEDEEAVADQPAAANADPISLDDKVRISFLPTVPMQDLLKKTMFQHTFDMLYVGSNWGQTTCFNAEFGQFLKDGAKVIVENPKFVLDMKKEALQENKTTVDEAMIGQNCYPVGSPDVLKDSYFKYVFQSPPDK